MKGDHWRVRTVKYRTNAEKLTIAYAGLIKALCWEHDRWLKLAIELEARDPERARRMIDQQVGYIREQATR